MRHPPTDPLTLAHLQAAVDACSDGILRLDAAGRIQSWNAAAARILAPAGKPANGTPLADAFVDHGLCADLVARAVGGEDISGQRLEVDGRDGRRGPVLLTLAPLAGNAGASAVLRDIGEQTSAQDVLAQSERRLKRAEAMAMTGSFVLDAADGTEQWSEGMYRIHGVDPAGFTPDLAHHLALVSAEDRERVAAQIEATLGGDVLPGTDHPIDRPDGTTSWLFLAVEPLTGADGRVIGLSGVCQDVNARVASETALQHALVKEQAVSEELRRVDALKDEFLATVSHELRTPLTSIAGFAAVLHDVAPAHRSLIEPIERNGREMHRLIQRLLDQARLESGRVSVEPARFLLAPAVHAELVDLAEQLAGVTVAVDVPADLEIVMDPPAFALVLGNLLGNAAKYAPGGIVTVSAAAADGGVTVSVADDGPGIAPEFQEHLFEAFFRVPHAYRQARGSGFGLAIVRRYVELHGGTVRCRSVPGHGTTFTFTIPVGGAA